jgi:hypothetical protein
LKWSRKCSCSREPAARMPVRVGGEAGKPPVEIGAVTGVDPTARELHVLLRHRPAQYLAAGGGASSAAQAAEGSVRKAAQRWSPRAPIEKRGQPLLGRFP